MIIYTMKVKTIGEPDRSIDIGCESIEHALRLQNFIRWTFTLEEAVLMHEISLLAEQGVEREADTLPTL